jgi:hypothetical protein
MSDLQEMRSTWRPRLAHSVTIQVHFAFVAALIAIVARPDAGASIVAALMALYGFGAALFGLRQWGKNNGAE